MTWADVKKGLTTPPPPRPPPPKYPLFTKDFFSTKSFGPGHIVGAVVLIGGLFGISKYFIARGQAQVEENRRYWAQQQQQRPVPAGAPPPPPPEPSLARIENQRGQYGRKP